MVIHLHVRIHSYASEISRALIIRIQENLANALKMTKEPDLCSPFLRVIFHASQYITPGFSLCQALQRSGVYWYEYIAVIKYVFEGMTVRLVAKVSGSLTGNQGVKE